MQDLWNVFYTCWTCQPYFIYSRPEIYGRYSADKKCMKGLLYIDGLWKPFPHEHFLFPKVLEDFWVFCLWKLCCRSSIQRFSFCRKHAEGHQKIYERYSTDRRHVETVIYRKLTNIFQFKRPFICGNPVEDFPSRKNPAEKPVETRGWHFMHMRRSQSLSRPFKILPSVEDLLQIFSLQKSCGSYSKTGDIGGFYIYRVR